MKQPFHKDQASDIPSEHTPIVSVDLKPIHAETAQTLVAIQPKLESFVELQQYKPRFPYL